MINKKTKELLKEVSNYIKTEMGFNVMEDGFSDYEGKYLVNSTNPNFYDEMGRRRLNQWKYIHHIKFSVDKFRNKEKYIIWDKRINQPYTKSKFCVYEGSFGRYEFNNKEDFYTHINSDFGMDEFELFMIKRNQIISNHSLKSTVKI
jgi:hypothetical protein